MALELAKENIVAAQRANKRCGPLRETVITVWDCGDPYCACSQVVVEEMHDNPLFHGATWTVTLALGTYYTDGEGTPEKWEPDIAAARLAFPHAKDLYHAAPTGEQNG